VFQEGDEVVLALGGNQCTLGTFVGLRKDPKWADIRERNGVLKRHPLEWLARAPEASV